MLRIAKISAQMSQEFSALEDMVHEGGGARKEGSM
jgi:hypothetical protein